MSTYQPQFSTTVPENYDKYLVPILFQPFAELLATKVAELMPLRVLELACGTGAVTRSLAQRLPAETRIVATDFSRAMLEHGQQNVAQTGEIVWQVADACDLPFEDANFDVVACQFGVMFFPDKATAMAEAFRVLMPGGHFLFSTWGAMSKNEFFAVVEETLSAMFPDEETPFMPTPLSMSNPDENGELARNAGFDVVEIMEDNLSSGPHDPISLASGFAFGTPLSVYLTGQGYDLGKVHSALAAAFAKTIGDPMTCNLNAIVCHATKL